MVKEFLELIRDEIATWVLIVIGLVWGFIKMGPQYIYKLYQLQTKIRQDSNMLKKEYLAELEITIERMGRKLTVLENKLENKQKTIDRLMEENYEKNKLIEELKKEKL